MRPSTEARFRLALALAVSIWFGVFYAGADWLMAAPRALPSLATPLDGWVPFWPWFAAFYLMVTPFLWVPLVVLKDRGELIGLAGVLMVEIVIATVIYLTFPIADPPVPPGPYPLVYRLADTINLTRNNLPSLHVTLTLAVLLALWPHLVRFRPWVLGLAVMICVSTLFTRQHDLASVTGGVVLAFAGHLLIRPWFARHLSEARA